MVKNLLRQQVSQLPLTPGVYLFKDSVGTVLYVGKATVLRDRVRSYFAADVGRGPGIEKMVQLAAEIAYYTTETEVEALLLEAKLIRQYKPRYNILLRDDKSFALIRIDLSEEFPGVYVAREKELEALLAKRKRLRTQKGRQKIDQQEFYGPYLSAWAVKAALRGIRRIWPFRDCTAAKFNHYAGLGHGCLYASLGLCPAPCVPTGRLRRGGDVALPVKATVTGEPAVPRKAAVPGEFAVPRGAATSGKTSPISPDQREWVRQSYQLHWEQYRRNIDQLRAFLRGDREQVMRQVEADMAAASDREDFESAKLYRDRLRALSHLQSMAQVNRLTERLAMQDEQAVGTRAPQYDPAEDVRIEGYDISNIQGEYAVGVAVSLVLRRGKVEDIATRQQARDYLSYEKAKYRKFRIRYYSGVSDVDMLREILTRRMRRGIVGEAAWSLPDLLIVDGGTSQLRIAQEVVQASLQRLLKERGSAPEVWVGAVAKGPTRRKVDLHGSDWSAFPNISPEAWRHIAEVTREEAHRFAITFYRQRHRKGFLT
jgi:excinuclease UvrABC nuclease subunit